jgi:hypothetical protein
MKIMAAIAYIVVLFSELFVLERVGVAPGSRYWWALVLGYGATAIYGVVLGGE